MELKENAMEMHACCEIFSFSHTTEDRSNCSMECLSDEGDSCCFDECFADRTGIFVDEAFNTSAVLKSITRDETVGEAEISVVKNSIEKCEKSLNTLMTSEICEIPEYVYKFSQCVFIENYKNCPKVVQNSECQNLGKVLENCNKIVTTRTTTKRLTKTRNPDLPVPWSTTKRRTSIKTSKKITTKLIK